MADLGRDRPSCDMPPPPLRWLAASTTFADLQPLPPSAWDALAVHGALPPALLSRWTTEAIARLEATRGDATPPAGTRSLARLHLRLPIAWPRLDHAWPLLAALGGEIFAEVLWALPRATDRAHAHQRHRELLQTTMGRAWFAPTRLEQDLAVALGWGDLLARAPTPLPAGPWADETPLPVPHGARPILRPSRFPLSSPRIINLLAGPMPPMTLAGLRIVLAAPHHDAGVDVGTPSDRLAWWVHRTGDPHATFNLAEWLIRLESPPADWPALAPTARAIGLTLLCTIASSPRTAPLEALMAEIGQWLQRYGTHSAVVAHWPLRALLSRDGSPWWHRVVHDPVDLCTHSGARTRWGPMAGTLSWPIWWEPGCTPPLLPTLLRGLPQTPSGFDRPLWQDLHARAECHDWRGQPLLLSRTRPPSLPAHEAAP